MPRPVLLRRLRRSRPIGQVCSSDQPWFLCPRVDNIQSRGLDNQLCQLFTIARKAQLREGGVCVTATYVRDDGDLESNHVFQFDSVVLDLLSRSR
jgi:hypothetical protein